MAKKINRDAESIIKLLSMGYKQKEIVQILKLKKQKVSYWAIKVKQNRIQNKKRKKKLKDIYLSRIIKWAKNKTTSTMSCRIISAKINSILDKRNEVDKRNRPLSISYRTINNYLKEYYGRPKKIRKAFYLSEEQKDKRVKFCRDILNKNINYDNVMFTDECKINLSSYTNDWIRLEPSMKEKLKKGEQEAYDLINRPIKKFEDSIMIAGGISYHGLSKLIILDGTMNNFAYGQTLLFFKEDIESISKKYKIKLLLEQDGAPAHKSKSNIHLLDKLFGESGWIQNPPNSPDLASPIENLWAILKPRVKRRNPKSIDQLKAFVLEEWNSVPINLIQNLCKGYIERLKKVINLNGRKLEPEHLYKNTHEVYNWETPENLPGFRYVYNDSKVKKYKENEMKELKAEIKKIKSSFNKKIKASKRCKKKFKKRDLKNLSIGRALSIINKPTNLEEEKKKKLDELEKKLDEVENMTLKKYIEYKESKDKEKLKKETKINCPDEGNEPFVIIIENVIEKFESLIKNDKEIRYRLDDSLN